MNLAPRITPFFACLLLVPLGLLQSASAFAVSLGDELILSRLGDPVEVEIEVLQWEDMDLDRVQISAASREEYDVFKLTWLPVLEHLNFNLVGPDLDGNVRVLISSRDPLNEPFLELLLVLRWPGGSLRREYVLLFDPPGAPLAVAQPVTPAPEPAQRTPEPELAAPALVMNVPQLPVQEEAPAVEEPAANDAGESTPLNESTVAEPPPQVVAFVAPQPAPDTTTVVEENIPDVAAPPASTNEATLTAATPAVPSPPGPTAAPIPSQPVQTAAPIPSSPAPDVEVETAPDVEVETAPDVEPQVVTTPAPAVVADTPAVDAARETVAGADSIEPAVETNEAVADARTQVAIDVETLVPQAAATVLDTTRRTYQVRSGDSLWNIARQFRPAGAGENLYQMLLGIHDLNRNSFINGNISLLKANALLQMPTEADIAAIDPDTAQAEFDRRWDAGTERFDAVQRGEAIPLFVNETPVDEPAAPIEPDLPPGTEAPPPAADESGLIMVSATNAALPLQLAPADDLITPDSPATNGEPAAEPATVVAFAEPVIDEPVPIQGASDAATASNASGVTTAESADTTARVVTVTAELETEVAAMRVRRETAEALARQLQESLQRAQAERAAQAGLLAPQNLPLAGGALALVGALVAGVVFMLKLAGELRTARIGNDGAFASTRSQPTRLDAARVTPVRVDSARTEPTWNDASAKAPEPRDPQDPTQIEVIELEPAGESATAASSDDATDPDDLFARMDNMLGGTQKSPQK